MQLCKKHGRPCRVSRFSKNLNSMKEIHNISKADFMAAVLPKGTPDGWEPFNFKADEYCQCLKMRRATDAPGYEDGWEYKTVYLADKINNVSIYVTLKKLGYRIPYDPFPALIVG